MIQIIIHEWVLLKFQCYLINDYLALTYQIAFYVWTGVSKV